MKSKRDLYDLSKLVDQTKDKLEDFEKEKADLIESLISIVEKIIRFIDYPILISTTFEQRQDKVKLIQIFYEKKGILVYLDNQDKLEEISQTISVNNIFPHEQRKMTALQHNREGHEVYLTREGKMILFLRKGSFRDDWVNHIADNKALLLNPREVSPLEMVQTFDDFPELFLFNFKRAIANAIIHNPKKEPILKKVIAYINDFEEFQQEEMKFHLHLKADPKNVELLCKYAKFLYQRKRDYHNARELYKQAMGLEPDNLDVKLNFIGFLQNGAQSFSELESFSTQLYTIYPDNARVCAALADLWFYRKRDTTVKSEDFKPDPVEVKHTKELYLKAMQLDPSNDCIIRSYAMFLTWFERDYKQVILYCEKAINLNPDVNNISTIIGLMGVMIATTPSRIEKSKAPIPPITQDLIDVWKDKLKAIDKEGITTLYHALDSFSPNTYIPSHSVEIFEKIIEKEPHKYYHHYNFSEYLLARGEYMKAEEQAKLALLYIPPPEKAKITWPWVILASAMFLQGKNDAANEVLSKLKKIFQTIQKSSNNSIPEHILALEMEINLMEYYNNDDEEQNSLNLQRIKELLQNHVYIGEEDRVRFRTHISHSILRGRKNSRFMSALLRVLQKLWPVSKLEKFPIWNSL